MKDDTKELQDIIISYQARTGLSQKAIGEILGVRQESVCGWLTGKSGITRKNALLIRQRLTEGTDENPTEIVRDKVISALIACDGLSGEAREKAVKLVRGLDL